MTKAQGIFPEVLTFFGEDGELDLVGTVDHLEWLASQGVHGVVVGGTSGEFIALSDEERRQVIEAALEAIGNKIPVIAGTGYASLRQTVELSRFAERSGVAAVSVIQPYFLAPPREAVLRHYRELRARVSVPIWLDHNPGRSGGPELRCEDIASLADEGVIKAFRSTVESVAPVHTIKELCGSELSIFYGTYGSPMEAILGGADGWISGILNVVATQALRLWNEANVEKNIEKAWKTWMEISPFVRFYTSQPGANLSELAVFRAGLELMGRPSSFSRAPLYPLAEMQWIKLRDLFRQLGWR